MPSLWHIVALGFVFSAWVVSLAGLAALQYSCPWDASVLQLPYIGFSQLLDCTTIFRFPWFIVAYEIVLIVILAVTIFMDHLRLNKIAMVGLFAVATMLYINLTDAYLTAITKLPMYSSGAARDNARTLFAGLIMTCVANMCVLITVGMAGAYAPHKESRQAPNSNKDDFGPMGKPIGTEAL